MMSTKMASPKSSGGESSVVKRLDKLEKDIEEIKNLLRQSRSRGSRD